MGDPVITRGGARVLRAAAITRGGARVLRAAAITRGGAGCCERRPSLGAAGRAAPVRTRVASRAAAVTIRRGARSIRAVAYQPGRGDDAAGGVDHEADGGTKYAAGGDASRPAMTNQPGGGPG
jgi:hypothetical protein